MLAGYVAAARNTAPFVVAAIGGLVLILASTMFVNSEGFGYDYLAYHDAARRIMAGEPLYLPGTADAFSQGRYEGLYLYPPQLALLLTPFATMGDSAATLAWMVLRLALLVGTCLVLPISWRARLATLGVAGVSFPVLMDLNIGNVSIVVLALCAVAWRWMDTPGAAIAHALLAVFRFPFLIFGLSWLAQRRFRLLVWTIACGIGFTLIVVPILGFGVYAEYFEILGGLRGFSSGPHNFSFESVAIGLGLPEVIGRLALMAGYAIGIASAIFASMRRDDSTAFVVTAVATLLISPFIHPHYLVLLLVPAAWLMDRGHWWGLVLPLLGWLPDPALPFTGLLAIAVVLAVSEERKPIRASRAT
jgi:hypothetical protein